MAGLNSIILQDYGGVSNNDLRNILNDDTEFDEQSATSLNASNYPRKHDQKITQ